LVGLLFFLQQYRSKGTKMVKSITLAGIAVLAMTAAHADQSIQLASLSSVEGKILVNQGHGFVAAKPGMMLSDGDRVIALDGSSAAVVYADGCVTQLKENNVLAMNKSAGCKQQPLGTGEAAPQPVRVAQAIGGPQSRVPQQAIGGATGGPAFIPRPSYIPLLIGGLGVAGMMGDTYSHHGMRPISPQ
jgi:hypothetical protein